MQSTKGLSIARALNIAMQGLLAGRSMSMKDISRQSGCSTATLYEVFENKDKFILTAIADFARHHRLAGPEPDKFPSSLAALLDFAVQRIKFLSSPTLRGIIASQSRSDEVFCYLNQHTKGADPLQSIIPLVRDLIDANIFRDADEIELSYTLFSALSYEPFISRIWLNKNVLPELLAYKIFIIFATEEGRRRIVAALQEHHDPFLADHAFTDHLSDRHSLSRA